MSIYDQQRTTITQDAYIRVLRQGLQPLAWRIQTLFKELQGAKSLGLPFFDHKTLKEDTVSNLKQWNQELLEIAFDLKIAFAEAKSQAQRIMALAIYNEHEHNKLMRRIKEITRRCELLEDRLNNPGFKGFTDSFTDFSMVETIGDRNGLGRTTALVDLNRGSTRLPRLTGIPAKYDLADAYINAKGSGVTITAGDIKNILSDSINETWQASVEGSGNASVTITLSLDVPVLVNCIELELDRTVDTSVAISVKGNPVPIECGDFIAWQFEPEEISELTLTITKSSTKTLGSYAFAVRRLSLKLEKFLNRGVLITKSFPLKSFSEIQLTAQEMVPAQTNIKYYLSLENPGRAPEWQDISQDRKLTLANGRERFGLLDSGAATFGTEAAKIFNISYYNIGILEYLPVPGTLEIYTGEKMWAVDEIALPQDVGWKPSLADWVGKTPENRWVVDTSRPVIIFGADKLYRLVTYVYCQYPTPVDGVVAVATSNKLALYVNSSPVSQVTGVYSFLLKQGWNRIEYIVAGSSGGEFAHGLLLDIIGQKVYASNKALKEVSLHDLTCNTSPYDREKFALVPGANGYSVVVNYDPVAVDYMGQGCRYYYSYRYLEDIQGVTGFRMMAVLSRTNLAKEVTPEILGYRLLVK